MAETALQRGESLPLPNPSLTDADGDLEEPIYLLLEAATHVAEVPQEIPA
jgi:hypothetical protein